MTIGDSSYFMDADWKIFHLPAYPVSCGKAQEGGRGLKESQIRVDFGHRSSRRSLGTATEGRPQIYKFFSDRGLWA